MSKESSTLLSDFVGEERYACYAVSFPIGDTSLSEKTIGK